MMPIVHARVAAVAFAFIRNFPADDISRKMLPGVDILDANTHISQLCDVNHISSRIVVFPSRFAPSYP